MKESNRNPVIVDAGVESSAPSSGGLNGIVGVVPVPNSFDIDFGSMLDFNPDQGLDDDVAEPAAIAGAPLMGASRWTPGDAAFVTVTAPDGTAAIATPTAPRPMDADALPLVDDDALISPVASTPNKAEALASASASSTKVESDSCCKLCGYRPKGDPRWFVGSMAKHMRTIHSDNPQIFRCPYPGCTSQYSKRADNLRQHQIEKNHFVDDEEKQGRRPRKRKRPSDGGVGGD